MRDGVIALTKTDLLDDDDIELAMLDIADHVAGTFLAAAPIVPVAVPFGRPGPGLDRLIAELDALVARVPAARDRAGRVCGSTVPSQRRGVARW